MTKLKNGLSVVDTQGSGSVIVFSDVYVTGIFRKQRFDVFRPFDEAKVSAVKVFFRTEVVGFAEVVEAIAVEMVDDGMVFRFVFIDNGKSGAIDNVDYLELFAECLDKGSFSCTHAAIESENFPLVDELDELFGSFVYCIE